MRIRAVLSFVVLSIACLLAPLALVAFWASGLVSDTDRYVEAVAPLADDPDIQRAVADAVTRELALALERRGVGKQTIERVRGVAGAAVERQLATDGFSSVWRQTNRDAHKELVGLFGGKASARDEIVLDTGPLVAQAKDRLADRGFALAEVIPPVDASFTLVDLESLPDVKSAYDELRLAGTWLPVVASALFLIGVLVARDRLRALMRGALGVAVTMVALFVALLVLRGFYLGSTPGEVLPDKAAASVYDTLVAFLRTGLLIGAGVALLVALAALVAGRLTRPAPDQGRLSSAR